MFSTRSVAVVTSLARDSRASARRSEMIAISAVATTRTTTIATADARTTTRPTSDSLETSDTLFMPTGRSRPSPSSRGLRRETASEGSHWRLLREQSRRNRTGDNKVPFGECVRPCAGARARIEVGANETCVTDGRLRQARVVQQLLDDLHGACAPAVCRREAYVRRLDVRDSNLSG